MEFYKRLKLLCDINGISGRENKVVSEIVKQLEGVCDSVTVDPLMNIIAFKKGKHRPKNKIMLVAHTDEVGMIVTAITNDGLLKFDTVGGINPKVIIGREVIVDECGIHGVIGTKAIHQQSADERKTAVKTDALYIDIGAKSKEEAMTYVSLGDSVCFKKNYTDLGSDSVLSKALDDRVGCAILLDIANSELYYDTYFCFTSQEEVGLRGATVAANTVSPDVAIIVETTASGDVSGVSGEKRVSVIGDGAVVSYMDRHTIYDKGLYDLSFKLAKEKDIKAQTKTMVSGGNDAGAIHKSGKGVRTIAVSVPTKYIHSPSSVAKKSDIDATLLLVKALCESVGEV